MKRKTMFATMFVLGTLPLAAFATGSAQSSGGSGMPAASSAKTEQTPAMFKQLDADHDGYISKSEAKRSADVSARFAKLDVDHDGRISVQEYAKGAQG